MDPVTCVGPCLRVAQGRYCYYFSYVFCQKSDMNVLLCMEKKFLLQLVTEQDLSLFVRYRTMLAIPAASPELTSMEVW